MMEEEREDTVICSCGDGLFLPSDGPEGIIDVRKYVLQVEAKGRGSFRSLKAARKWLKDHGELDGQEEIDGLTEGSKS